MTDIGRAAHEAPGPWLKAWEAYEQEAQDGWDEGADWENIPEAFKAGYEAASQRYRAVVEAASKARTAIGFLISCVRCGESLSADEEAELRALASVLEGDGTER